MIGNGIKSDFLMDVARGVYSDKIPFGGYGEKITTGADSGVIWQDGIFDIPSSTGIQMQVASTSANDAATGTNARIIEMHYLDTNLIPREEYITLNGLTPVLTVATNIRFLQMLHIHTIGSIKYAAGDITVTPVGGGQIYSIIKALTLHSASSARMVPAGKRCVIYNLVAGSVSGTAAAKTVIRIAASEFDVHQYSNPLLLFPYGSLAYQDNSFGMTFPVPFPFREGTVIAMQFECDKGATISGMWFGLLENA